MLTACNSISRLAVAGLLMMILLSPAALAADKSRIVVAVPRNAPPQYLVDDKGAPTGFAIDVFNAIARRAGLEPVYRIEDSWIDTFAALRTGIADVIPNIGISDKRRKDFAFSSSIQTIAISLFVRHSSNNINGIEDLAGKQVGTVRGNISEKLIKQISGARLVVFNDTETMLLALLSGRIDAFIYPKPWALGVARKAGIDDQFRIVGNPVHEIKRAIAVNRDNPELLARINKALSGFLGSQEYRNIYRKWHGQPAPTWTVRRVLIWLGGVFLLLIAVLSLRHYRATIKLNEQLQHSIDSRQQAEAALKKESASASRERTLLHSLINSVPDLIFLKDTDGVYMGWNRSCEQFMGIKEQDVLGKTDFDLFPHEQAESFRESDQQILSTSKSHVHEEWVTSASGDRQLFETLKTPHYDTDGRVLGLIGISRNITQRHNADIALKNSETLYRQLVNSSIAGVWRIDAEGNTIYVNQAMSDMLQLDNPDSAIGVYYANYLNLTDNSREDLFSNRANQFEAEITGIHGQKRLALFASTPVYTAENRANGVIINVVDITTEKEQQELLRRSQKMEALGKLSGGIAHDYNNLLGVILGYSEMIGQKVEGDETLQRYVEAIIQAGKRGSKLTRKLLSFSRRESNEAEAADINKLLIEDQNMMEKTLTARVKLVLSLADNLWHTWIDMADLEDAILNMCINAMHAMPEGGNLVITTENRKLFDDEARQLKIPAGDYISLTIADTGCGMDKDTCSRIFDPFFSTKGDKGSGLGLSQVYGFVTRSGGSIRVESEPGKGTTFELLFPRHDKAPTEKSETSEAGESDFYGTETILVVDDEPAMLFLAEEIFRQHGYEVLTANNGLEALKILEERHVDLLLSDVIMPEMDGYQLVNEVIRLYPDIAIQMASGFTDNRQKSAVDESLHKNMLGKPYTSTRLLSRIRELLDNHKAGLRA